jgi:hypothetical protein
MAKLLDSQKSILYKLPTMILVSDNDWSKCKNVNDLLLFKVNLFIFMVRNNKQWTLKLKLFILKV